jgi:TRAP-type C4-dicarboxylate transport system substrate-binding protein
MVFGRSTILAVSVFLIISVSPADAVQLKIATLAPDGSAWMNALREGADEIEERSEGRVKFRFYPGGTMGGESAVVRKIRIGQVHGGVFTAGTLGDIAPDFQIYSLPVAFRSYDEVDFVRQKVDDALIETLAEDGYVSFGLIEGGFAYLMSTEPISDFDQLKGLKAWIPEGDEIGQAILESAGLSAIPLPLSDVLTGLQTGLVNTVAGPPVGAVALQWFTKVKYLTEIPIVYTYGSIAIGAKHFGRLSEDDQALVREVLGKVSGRLDRGTREDNERAKEALAKQGVTFVEATPENLARWQEVADEATVILRDKGVFSAELMNEIQELIAEARNAGE